MDGVKGEARAKKKPAYMIICSWHYCFMFRWHRKEADPFSYAGIPPEVWALLESKSITLIGSDIATDLISLRIPNAPIADTKVIAEYMHVMHGFVLERDTLGLRSIAKGVWNINFDYKVRNVTKRRHNYCRVNFYTFHRKTPDIP
jgi:hypothetical protein